MNMENFGAERCSSRAGPCLRTWAMTLTNDGFDLRRDHGFRNPPFPPPVPFPGAMARTLAALVCLLAMCSKLDNFFAAAPVRL